MPIRHLLKGDVAFTPEEADLLITTFEDTLTALKLLDRNDPVTRFVARHIIQLAKDGERDPVRLRELTIESLTGS